MHIKMMAALAALGMVIGSVTVQAQDASDTVASDTVWLVTKYHWQLLDKYRNANAKCELEANDIKDMLRHLAGIRAAGITNVSRGSLEDAPKSSERIIPRDRNDLRSKLLAERDSLRTLYARNTNVIALVEAQVRRGKYYLRSSVPDDGKLMIPPNVMDSLYTLQVTTPGAWHYSRYDWIRWHLGGARIAALAKP